MTPDQNEDDLKTPTRRPLPEMRVFKVRRNTCDGQNEDVFIEAHAQDIDRRGLKFITYQYVGRELIGPCKAAFNSWLDVEEVYAPQRSELVH